MRHLIVVAHNLRSCHNVGSLLRTAEGLGVAHVVLSGYTPYPFMKDDQRLPHEARKIHSQISKTALGAERLVSWEHSTDIKTTLTKLRQDEFSICAVEQTIDSMPLPDFKPPEKLVLLVGREVEGIEPEILAMCDNSVEIPMAGKKESFNVVQAAAMAIYHCTFL